MRAFDAADAETTRVAAASTAHIATIFTSLVIDICFSWDGSLDAQPLKGRFTSKNLLLSLKRYPDTNLRCESLDTKLRYEAYPDRAMSWLALVLPCVCEREAL